MTSQSIPETNEVDDILQKIAKEFADKHPKLTVDVVLRTATYPDGEISRNLFDFVVSKDAVNANLFIVHQEITTEFPFPVEIYASPIPVLAVTADEFEKKVRALLDSKGVRWWVSVLEAGRVQAS